MQLNKGWKEGTIGIPTEGAKYPVIHFYVKANKRRSKNGIDGGKITGLILNSKDNTLAYFAGEKGWVIDPASEEAQIALSICLKEYN